jgi:Na+/H+-dicarboxylate symporter/ABC-type amino acid transport substrate-binding protein
MAKLPSLNPRQWDLPARVLLAMVLGIACGLFFGESCAVLEPVGHAFVMLLQMTVLPYIPCALIEGFGALSPDEARTIFRRGWMIVLALWGATFLVLFCAACIFPTPLPGPTSQTVDPRQFEQSFLSLLIPENPVSAMSNNVVSAVAVFGVFLGTALMHVPGKEDVVAFFGSVNRALLVILRWISQISPLGIFALLASSAGTVRFTQLGRIDLYLVSFVLGTCILAFFLLPALQHATTGISSADFLRQMRAAILLGFTTGLPSVTLPHVQEGALSLARRRGIEVTDDLKRSTRTLLPLAYCLAQVGNLFVLLFVLFAAFYFRHPLTPWTTALLALLDIPMSFGGPSAGVSAVSFVSDQLHLPGGALALYTEMMPLTRCFQVMLSVVSMTVLVTMLIVHAHGRLELRLGGMLKRAVPTALVLVASLLLARTFLHAPDSYDQKYAQMTLEAVDPHLAAPIVAPSIAEAKRAPVPLVDIRSASVLRIGFNPGVPPFAYFNGAGSLVGFDVAMGCRLARDLGVRAEFVPFHQFSELPRHFDAGDFDICMSAVVVTLPRLGSESFSRPVISQPLALVVPGEEAKRWRDDPQAATRGIPLGGIGAFADLARARFPECGRIVNIERDGMDALVKGKVQGVLWSKAQGEAWTALNPGYVVVRPEHLGTVYFAYVLPTHSARSVHLLDYWLEMKAADGFTKRQTDYWINDLPVTAPPPRWSVWRNVLGL